jgi:hypothetical protein
MIVTKVGVAKDAATVSPDHRVAEVRFDHGCVTPRLLEPGLRFGERQRAILDLTLRDEFLRLEPLNACEFDAGARHILPDHRDLRARLCKARFEAARIDARDHGPAVDV